MKNNILFIGPYRQRDINGLWSKALAHNIIQSSSNVQLRPIFIDTKYKVNNIDKVLIDHEQTRLDSITTVVQHVPIEQASVINAVEKNILIPIISSNLVDKHHVEQLTKFNALFIDNKYDAIRVSQSYPILQKITKNIDYVFEIDSTTAAAFNIGLFNHSKKLYMVCDYRLNMRTIYDIIVSFVANIKSRDIALILFMLDISSAEKTELENFIQETYKNMDVPYTIGRVIVAPITSDLNNVCAAHKSGDVFIDAADYGSNSINTKIAESLNKQILKVDTEYVFGLVDNSNRISHKGSVKLSSQAINNSIKRYTETLNPVNATSLFKTQHINKYI